MGSGGSVAAPGRRERRVAKRNHKSLGSASLSLSPPPTQKQDHGLSSSSDSPSFGEGTREDVRRGTPATSKASQSAPPMKGAEGHTPPALFPASVDLLHNSLMRDETKPLASRQQTSGNGGECRAPSVAIVAPATQPRVNRGAPSPTVGSCVDNPLSMELGSFVCPENRAPTDEGVDSLRTAFSTTSDDLSFGPRSGRVLLPERDTAPSDRHACISPDAAKLMALRKRIRPSWKYAVEMGNIPTIGVEVYHRMLAVNPNLSAFFGGVFIADQGTALMDMIGSTFDSDSAKPHQGSVEQLISAGARHRGYGVTEDTLPALKDAFLDVFPHFTDSILYNEAASAWHEFFDLVIAILQRGARSAEGERLGCVYIKQMTLMVARDWHLIEDRQDRDPNHKFITLMYQKGFLLNPSLASFEALMDVRVGKRIFDSITAIVDHLDELEVVEEYLTGMGVNHLKWRITYSDFVLFTTPFLETCEYYLSDVWTVAMEARLARLFQFLIDGMARGMCLSKAGSTTSSTGLER